MKKVGSLVFLSIKIIKKYIYFVRASAIIKGEIVYISNVKMAFWGMKAIAFEKYIKIKKDKNF